jgi:hypothetical protein
MPMRAYISITALVFCSLLLSSTANAAPTAGAGPSDIPPMVTYRPVIYVVGEGDAVKAPGVVIGVARELNKLVAQSGSSWDDAWVLPMPSYTPLQVAAMCPQESDVRTGAGANRMVGFIVISLTYTITDRFYIIVSHDATHIYPFVQIVACPAHGEYPIDAPTVIAAISQLSTANGTAWIISQSEVSVPLASYAGVAGLFSKKFTANDTNTILAAALSSATNYSIPGFSEGRRLQHSTQHLADDITNEFAEYWCPRIRQPGSGPPGLSGLTPNGSQLCAMLAPVQPVGATPAPAATASP